MLCRWCNDCLCDVVNMAVVIEVIDPVVACLLAGVVTLIL